MSGQGRLPINTVKDSGEPLEPKENARKFTSQAGVLVRDMVPISIPEWHKPKDERDGASYVSENTKKLLWDTLMTHFNLPENFTEAKKEKVKEWTLKKMAIQFQTWKKNLWKKYENEDPKFTGRLEKIKEHWPAFKAYKISSTAVSRSVKNKINAGKKKYYHRLGSGGYKTAIPKWQAFEAQLMDAGIIPQTWDWPNRSKFWLFAHGAGLDPKTGQIVAQGKWKEKIAKITPLLVDAIEKVRKGEYIPDRENDELTLALGNPEHVGRIRALGGGVTMKEAWPECADCYRSRSRKKKHDSDRLSELERLVQRQQQIDSISRQRAPDQQLCLEDPQADAAPSRPKSSVGSTHLEGCGASYPVDYVTEKTDCELHVSMRNISFKVAVGYVYPIEDGAMYHHDSIPAGYARVGVDDIVTGFETMELDIPGGDDEKTLGDVKRGFALWNKKYIVFSDPLPRPPQQQRPSTPPRSSPPQQQRQSTPPRSSPPQQQSPHLPERDPSASPPSRYPPREEAPVKRTSSPVRKKPRKEKTPPPIQKLPWERTDEETAAIVRSEVDAHWAPKVPEIPFEKTLDPVLVVRTVENLYDPVPSPPSDYRRSIERSYDEMGQAKKGKQVPQLGEQPVQSVPPLKVFDDKAVQSSQQYIGSTTDHPIAEVAYKYVLGENLVENVRSLPTRMRNLHTWYKNVAKTGTDSMMVGVKEEHYFQEYAVMVEFSELFQLYNLRALDKSIVSCYCL